MASCVVTQSPFSALSSSSRARIRSAAVIRRLGFGCTSSAVTSRTSSATVASRAVAMRASVSSLGFPWPRSRRPKFVGCTCERSARSCWLMPSALRNSRTRFPTARVTRLCSGSSMLSMLATMRSSIYKRLCPPHTDPGRTHLFCAQMSVQPTRRTRTRSEILFRRAPLWITLRKARDDAKSSPQSRPKNGGESNNNYTHVTTASCGSLVYGSLYVVATEKNWQKSGSLERHHQV